MTGEQDFALVIGIAHYPHLRPLEGPVFDAHRVKRWLCDRAGLPEANVELVTSEEEEEEERPILDEVDAAFKKIFKNARARGEAPRRLYVYFAGHGCSNAIDHIALLMANASLEDLNYAMNATEYRNALAQRLFPEQVYLFDCCREYDRRVSGRGPPWTFDPGGAPVPGFTEVVLYAAGFTQYASERYLFYSERRGLFTEALMEGLDGAAATLDQLTRRGVVTTDRLASYVYDRLNDLTKKEQVPTKQDMWWAPRGARRSLILATGITPWRKQVSVTFPPGTRRVVAQDEGLQIQADLEVSAGESAVVFDLELTSYTFTALPAGISSEPIRLLPDKPLASYKFAALPAGISSEPIRLLPDGPLQVSLGGS
jgi:hypothetical protein